jgi:hypothetical protein
VIDALCDGLARALQHLLERVTWRRDRRMSGKQLLERAGQLVGPQRPRVTAR